MKRINLSLLFQYSLALVGVLIAAARPAHAYLDPGTGSYAFQVGVAGVFGAIFSVKMFWSRVRQGISHRSSAGHRGDNLLKGTGASSKRVDNSHRAA